MPFKERQLQSLPPGTQLRHYKGGRYTVVGSCLIEATLQPGVLYQPLQGDSQDVTWMRPLAEFHDLVTTADGVVPRFEHIAESEENAPASPAHKGF